MKLREFIVDISVFVPIDCRQSQSSTGETDAESPGFY
jgi:hypothetical protein